MAITSGVFLIFLAIVLAVYIKISPGKNWIVLCTASLIFYASWFTWYLLAALALVILVSYAAAIILERSASETQKRIALFLAIVLLLLPLLFLKYSYAATTGLLQVFHIISNPYTISILQHLSAIGVSFYSFQAISYVIDNYLGIITPEPHLGVYAAYISFFPKLLQGPIERAGDLIPQLRKPYVFDYALTREGLLQIAWGAFKKLVIADRLGLYVNTIFANVQDYKGVYLILVVYAFAFQIYFDFSGYTDIALGVAKLFGIRLTQNFNQPYLARSVSEFWRRWHITFSRWILDYIFKPLQMSWRSLGNLGTALALILTFIISGIWHGSTWGYVVWGLLHGLYLAVTVYWQPVERKLIKKYELGHSGWVKFIQVAVTFHLVVFAWIFFRADTLWDAAYVVGHLFSGLISSAQGIVTSLSGAVKPGDTVLPGLSLSNTIILLFVLAFMVIVAIIPKDKKDKLLERSRPPLLRWSLYFLLVTVVLMFGIFEARTFIYNQF